MSQAGVERFDTEVSLLFRMTIVRLTGGRVFRMIRFSRLWLSAAICLLIVPASPSAASENQMSQRFQYGLSWRARPELSLKGVLQGRFREGMSDFYYHQTDLGLEYRPTERLRLPLAFRYQEKESGGAWDIKRYLLFDPTWRFLSLGDWDFDFRPRFQVKAEDFGLAYIRPMLNVSYSFRIFEMNARWWAFEDYYLQVDRELNGYYHDPNNFSTGVSWAMSPSAEISLYYMVYSYRPKNVGYWTHIHQPCLALSMKI